MPRIPHRAKLEFADSAVSSGLISIDIYPSAVTGCARVSGWVTHILASDPMSAALRRALEAEYALGTVLRNELSMLERPGPCPPGAEGWELNTSGAVRRCSSRTGSLETAN